MSTKQLGLWDSRSKDCPFGELLDEEDDHCYSFFHKKDGYEVIGEDHPEFGQWLADIRHVGFDVVAKPIPEQNLPLYIPVVRSGSQKLMDGVSYPVVAITLGDLFKGKELYSIGDIRSRFGISRNSKIILLCYGRDRFIEQIWAKRTETFSKIASLGFDLVTAVNYSVWFNQPHAERLINLKRSLLTFEDLQKLGVPAIPHVYWSGRKDLERWRDWISLNPNTTYLAINLQTERGDFVWKQTLEDLSFFVSILERPVHFFITGPSTPNRIQQLREILPSFSLANGHCARQAASSYLLSQENGNIKREYSKLPKNEIMRKDIAFYFNAMSIELTNQKILR